MKAGAGLGRGLAAEAARAQGPVSLDQLFPYPELGNPNPHIIPDSSASLFPVPIQRPLQRPTSPLQLHHSPTPPSTSSFDLFTSLDAAEAVASLQTAGNLPSSFGTSSQANVVNRVSFDTPQTGPSPVSSSEPSPRLHYLR